MKFFFSSLIILSSAIALAQNNCPAYSPPVCAKDEKIILNKDSTGCNTPVCAKKNSALCATYSKPLCTSSEIVLLKYKDGCPSPICAHMK